MFDRFSYKKHLKNIGYMTFYLALHPTYSYLCRD